MNRYYAVVARMWRRDMRLTQAQMAKLLNVKRGRVAHWEQERAEVPEKYFKYFMENWPEHTAG